MNTDDRRRLLPPVAMLHSFQLAARYDSVSRAAAEVGLTQSAVSRQISQLEEWVGTPLFDRIGRRVALNATGRRYADAIAPALSTIRQATRQAMTTGESRAIELATLPSFGMRWLAPRLGRLSARHPELIVNTVARADEFDFQFEAFDAAIHVGQADWPGVSHDLLFRERVVPVVSSELADRHMIRGPEDLLALPLLVQSRRPEAWRQWFALSSIDLAAGRALPAFSQFLMLAQAVLGGAGAALLPSFLIEPELESGSLVIPVDLPLDDDRAYWFVGPPDRLERPHVAQLRAWILDEAASDRAETDGDGAYGSDQVRRLQVKQYD